MRGDLREHRQTAEERHKSLTQQLERYRTEAQALGITATVNRERTQAATAALDRVIAAADAYADHMDRRLSAVEKRQNEDDGRRAAFVLFAGGGGLIGMISAGWHWLTSHG